MPASGAALGGGTCGGFEGAPLVVSTATGFGLGSTVTPLERVALVLPGGDIAPFNSNIRAVVRWPRSAPSNGDNGLIHKDCKM